MILTSGCDNLGNKSRILRLSLGVRVSDTAQPVRKKHRCLSAHNKNPFLYVSFFSWALSRISNVERFSEV